MIIRKTAIALALATCLASRASAAPPVPNTFTPGTPAKAADVNANFQFVMAQIAAAMPTGTVLPFAGPLDTAVPAGFLACDGASYATADYPALFAVIGYTYGGSGTTFNVPDLRGEFIRGADGMGTVAGARNVDPGRTLGSEQTDAFQGHWHLTGVNSDNDYSIITGSGGGGWTGGPNTWGIPKARTPITDGAHGTPRIASETRPRNVALNFIIRT